MLLCEVVKMKEKLNDELNEYKFILDYDNRKIDITYNVNDINDILKNHKEFDINQLIEKTVSENHLEDNNFEIVTIGGNMKISYFQTKIHEYLNNNKKVSLYNENSSNVISNGSIYYEYIKNGKWDYEIEVSNIKVSVDNVMNNDLLSNEKLNNIKLVSDKIYEKYNIIYIQYF